MGSWVYIDGEPEIFTQVANNILKDKRLTYKSIGLFAYLRHLAFEAKKQGNKFDLDDIVKAHKEGKDAVKAGIKELKDAGYINITPRRNKKTGTFEGWEWHITLGHDVTADNPDKKVGLRTITQKAENPTFGESAQILTESGLSGSRINRKSVNPLSKDKKIKDKDLNMSKGSSILGSKLHTRISKNDFKRLSETLKNLTGRISFEEILETLIDKSIEFIFIENDSRIRKHYKKNILDIDKAAVIKSVLAKYRHEKNDKPFQVIEKIYTLTCEKLALKLSQ